MTHRFDLGLSSVGIGLLLRFDFGAVTAIASLSKSANADASCSRTQIISVMAAASRPLAKISASSLLDLLGPSSSVVYIGTLFSRLVHYCILYSSCTHSLLLNTFIRSPALCLDLSPTLASNQARVVTMRAIPNGPPSINSDYSASRGTSLERASPSCHDGCKLTHKVHQILPNSLAFAMTGMFVNLRPRFIHHFTSGRFFVGSLHQYRRIK